MWKPSPNSLREKAPDASSKPLSIRLKEEALRLGFSSAGITSSSALFSRDAELQTWLDRGHAGPLEYMRQVFSRRDRFLQLIPDLKSLLVVTARYARESSSSPHEPAGKSPGRLARYAAGKDYHRVLRKKLRQLSGSLRRMAGPAVRTLAAVDTSPIPERALAEAAGLGFIGKNTCLIQPHGGSYLFLAVVLTNLELPPDSPIRWDCGSCTLCIQACPTGALEKPYQLDAGRCISALTIELKGPIPPPLRPQMKEWLFGCDICQEVCPYNHPLDTAVPWPEFQPETGAGARLPLREILAIRTEKEYTDRFAGTPLMRPKREGLLRNSAILAANLQRTDLLPDLDQTAQKDSSAVVREHAAWAADQLRRLNHRSSA